MAKAEDLSYSNLGCSRLKSIYFLYKHPCTCCHPSLDQPHNVLSASTIPIEDKPLLVLRDIHKVLDLQVPEATQNEVAKR